MSEKKISKTEEQPMYVEGCIRNIDIEREMKTAFLEYSMSVIVSRALPDVRDGLKPVHRRILYTMGEKDLMPDKPFHKSADTVGAVLGSYHPHGDASVYDAMVRLAQNFSMRYPLVDPQGNFGSVDGDPPAAYRYTEARLSRIATYMLKDIDKDTVDFGPNYDDRTTEPLVLPSRVPNLLMNGSVGIAVGMATNIPPHNLGELCDGINYLIENPDCTPFDLMQFITGPDFPTGGIIMGRSGIRAAYATGRGKIILRGRAEIEEENGSFRIVITELPYMVIKSRLIENMAELAKDKRIEGIRDLRDESDRDGMRIVVELKRDASPQIVLNQLYQYTQLQSTCGVIMLALKDGEPKVLNLKEMLSSYLEFQREVIRRRTSFDLGKAVNRAHVLEGLRRATDIIDEIIATIRACRGGSSEAKAAIMEKFGFDDPQAAAIVAFRLGQLAGLEILKIETELDALQKKIAEYEDILANDAHLYALLREELSEARAAFEDERRTEIADVSGEVDIEDLIPVESCIVTRTHFGYVKRIPADTYRSQKRGGRGISGLSRRDEDFVEDLFVTSTHDYLLFFSTRGRVYRMKGYEIPEGSRSSRGVNIVNLLPLEQNEKISAVIRLSDLKAPFFVTLVTRKGVIKRTELAAYENIRRSGVIGLTLDEDDELAWARLTDGTEELIVATRAGKAIRFAETDARAMGRTARGVRAIDLKPDDEVVGLCAVSEDEKILTVTADGKGRISAFDEYRLQSRGGQGVRNYDCAARETEVIAVRAVTARNDVILISRDGVIIRIHADEIAEQSRYGSGVRVMRLGEDDRVVTVARTLRDDLEEEEVESAAAERPAPTADEPDYEEYIKGLQTGKAEAESEPLGLPDDDIGYVYGVVIPGCDEVEPLTGDGSVDPDGDSEESSEV